MASRKPLTILQASAGELPAGDDLLLPAANASGARFSNGSVSVAHFMDAANYYFLLTAAGAPLAASYTAARPFYVNLSSGLVTFGNSVAVTGGLTSDVSTVSGGQARRIFNTPGAAADQKLSDILTDGVNWLFRLLNDAGTASSTWLQVVRNGYAAASVLLAATAIRLNGLVSVNSAPINDLSQPLQLNVSANSQAFFAVNRAGGYGMLFGYDNTTGGAAGVIRQVTTDPIDVIVNNTTKAVRFLPSGRVLLGTTTDDATNLLQVAGTVASQDINVAGSGGMAGGWNVFTATVSAAGGALGTASATVRWKKLGRTVFVSATATISANNTGAGTVNLSMPFPAAGNVGLAGREFTSSGKMIVGVMVAAGSILYITNYDGTYPATATGTTTLVVSGTYEANA